MKGKERRETPPQRSGGAGAEEPPLRAVSQRSGGAGAEEPCAAQNPEETATPLVRVRPQPLPGVSRLRVLLLYVLLVLLGVPVWWKATEVYRAAIPFHLLDQVVCLRVSLSNCPSPGRCPRLRLLVPERERER